LQTAPAELQEAPPKRAEDLDLLKSVLVLAMVAAHAIQIVVRAPGVGALVFSDFVDFIAFSGFMLAFGIGVGLSKPAARQRPLPLRLRPALRLLAAYWICAIAFTVLLLRQPVPPEVLFDLLTFARLAGWSEFLATFLLLYLLIAAARPALLWIGGRSWALAVATAAGLSSTLVVLESRIPFAATLFGSRLEVTYPLLAYLPWFLLGIWYGRHTIKVWHFIPALAATLLFHALLQATAEAARFPPSAIWFAGSAAYLLLLLALARGAARLTPLPRFLLTPGRHLLSILVCSNVALFAIRYWLGRPLGSFAEALALSLAIVAAVSGIWLVVEKRRTSPAPPR
ncbi:MAG: hypothetical protein WD230_04435, partial [Cucumibacter sp.]